MAEHNVVILFRVQLVRQLHFAVNQPPALDVERVRARNFIASRYESTFFSAISTDMTIFLLRGEFEYFVVDDNSPSS